MAPLKMKFQSNMFEWYSSPESFAIHFISMELTAVTSIHTEKYSVQPFVRCFTDSAAVLPTIINILTDTVTYSTIVLCTHTYTCTYHYPPPPPPPPSPPPHTVHTYNTPPPPPHTHTHMVHTYTLHYTYAIQHT